MIFDLKGVCKDLEIETSALFPESPDPFFTYKIVGGDFWSLKKEEEGEAVYFKNNVKVMNFPMITRTLPAFSEIRWRDLETTPYFTSGLEDIREAAREGRRIAVEGGPCLFGAWEVFMELTLKDGTVKVYDFNIGYLVENGEYVESEPLVMDAMKIYADEIEEIHFRDVKDGLTGQEIASVLYLFEAAKPLNAQVILSIPDFSYVKFLKAILAYLETWNKEPEEGESASQSSAEQEQSASQPSEEQEQSASQPSAEQKQSALQPSDKPDPKRQEAVRRIQEDCLAEFREIAYRITDLYLEVAKALESRYPDVKYETVHERRQELCEFYYEKRAPYIERNKILRTIRSSAEHFESLKDYISLSAIPFYLYGITDILHICSVDEADSYRKCKKAHKGHLQLSCLLYPEYVSADEETTVFYAEKQYKDYYPDFEEYLAEEDRLVGEAGGLVSEDKLVGEAGGLVG